MLYCYLLIFVQVFFFFRTCASYAYALWTLAYFSYKYLLSFVHVLLMHMFLMHMLHGHLLIFIQVFIVVRTCASNAYASWTLAYFCTSIYRRPYIRFSSVCFMDTCLLSSVHLLLEHMFYGYLLIFTQVLIVVHTFAFGAYALWILAYFYTSAYCRPYTCF